MNNNSTNVQIGTSATFRKRVAILGGSFDPPTISHLQVASETINLLGFEEVWFVPCGSRPDKKQLSPANQRLEMVRKAVADFFPAGFPVHVDPIEIENGKSIPTAFLMDQLQERYEATHAFHFIMGSDLIHSLHLWDDGERIIREMPTIVFKRKGYDNGALFSHANFPQNSIVVDEEKSLIGVISSTEIRRRVRQNTSTPFFGVSGIVTPAVIQHIAENGLYKEQPLAGQLQSKASITALPTGSSRQTTQSVEETSTASRHVLDLSSRLPNSKTVPTPVTIVNVE